MPEWEIALATLVFGIIGGFLTTAFAIGRYIGTDRPTFVDLRHIQAEAENDLRDAKSDRDIMIARVRSELESRIDDLSERLSREYRNYGETAAAIRSKVEQFEFWSRDNLATKRDIERVEETVKQLWQFIMDRATLKAENRGWMERRSAPTLTKSGLDVIAPILPAIKHYCLSLPDLRRMSETELQVEIAKTFRRELLDEICVPNQMSDGECVALVIEALRLENLIE